MAEHSKELKRILDRCTLVGECLIWAGPVQKSGKRGQALYPSLTFKGRTRRGNRVVLELTMSKGLGKLHALHTCDNSLCLNPEHLYAGTHLQNMKDKIDRKRDHNQNKKFCKKGHPFSGDNLREYGGRRACKICVLSSGRKHYANNLIEIREKKNTQMKAHYAANRERILARRKELQALRKEVL